MHLVASARATRQHTQTQINHKNVPAAAATGRPPVRRSSAWPRRANIPSVKPFCCGVGRHGLGSEVRRSEGVNGSVADVGGSVDDSAAGARPHAAASAAVDRARPSTIDRSIDHLNGEGSKCAGGRGKQATHKGAEQQASHHPLRGLGPASLCLGLLFGGPSGPPFPQATDSDKRPAALADDGVVCAMAAVCTAMIPWGWNRLGYMKGSQRAGGA